MTEIYHPSTEQNTLEDKEDYWQEKLEDAERAVSYAKRMLAQLAIERTEII